MPLNDPVNFDFLPELPKSNLDDRQFNDLYQECLALIPQYCPEWTDFNPSNPGITLVELFAWLTDQMLLRFNQIPRRNYIGFLELLGIRLEPPKAATTLLTFFIKPQSLNTANNQLEIQAGTEVGTKRTENKQSIIFSTNEKLVISKPRLIGVYRDNHTEFDNLSEISGSLNLTADTWQSRGSQLIEIFASEPQQGNSFYLFIASDSDLNSNILEIELRGEVAAPEGLRVNASNDPPRLWQAWCEEEEETEGSWQPILEKEEDDQTYGFRFNATTNIRNDNGILTASGKITLYLPKQLKREVTDNQDREYRYWIRCVCDNPQEQQGELSRYHSSPQIEQLSIRSIGGRVEATNCRFEEKEILGISDGKPGQRFYVSVSPILGSIEERKEKEEVIKIKYGTQEEEWEEVANFANSNSESKHYVVDNQKGMIQFGPLILESHWSRIPKNQETKEELLKKITKENYIQENAQRGKIPLKEAEIIITKYRSGGGISGNVIPHSLRILKTSLPYVDSVTNHLQATGGRDAQSLQEAALKVPNFLKNRDRAVTKEDFEILTQEIGGGQIDKVLCTTDTLIPGQVNLYTLVIHPDNQDKNRYKPFKISSLEETELKNKLKKELTEKTLIGIHLEFKDPDYVPIKITMQVKLKKSSNLQQEEDNINQLLNKFLDPLTGGRDLLEAPKESLREYRGKGWNFQEDIYASDIYWLMQFLPNILYVAGVEVAIESQESANQDLVKISKTQIVCCSQDYVHNIRFID